MICSKCRQRTGQMVCHSCYLTLEDLKKQQKQRSLHQIRDMITNISQLAQSDPVQQTTHQMLASNRKSILIHKIRKARADNEQRRERISSKQAQIAFLEKQVIQSQETLPLIIKLKQQSKLRTSQIQEGLHNITKELQRLVDCLGHQMTNKFALLIKYAAMDPIESCKIDDWQNLVQNHSSRLGQPAENDDELPEDINLLAEAGEEATRKMTAHLVRSINIINLLAKIHGIQLPFKTGFNNFTSTASLFHLICDSKGRFNVNFLKFHQANTIYLYSRACITVHHPEAQQGRLQQLHDALVKHLKGYSLSPLSFDVRKPLNIPELQAISVTSIGEQEKARKKEQEIVCIQEEDTEAEWVQKIELIGLKSVDSEEDIELLV